MQKNNSLRVAVLSLAVISGHVHAEATEGVKPVSTVGDLAHVQAERLMFKAEADRLDAQSAYLDKLPKAQVASLSQDSPAPNLKKIIAVNGLAIGTFVYQDGMTVEKAEGEKLPGGYTVLHLWPTQLSGEVTDRKGKVIEVGMSAKQTQPAAAPALTAATAQMPYLTPNNAVNNGAAYNPSTNVRVPAIGPSIATAPR